MERKIFVEYAAMKKFGANYYKYYDTSDFWSYNDGDQLEDGTFIFMDDMGNYSITLNNGPDGLFIELGEV